jgi:hypothetical protein
MSKMSGIIEGRIAAQLIKVGKPKLYVISTPHTQLNNAPDCISCNKKLFGIPLNKGCQMICGISSRQKRRKIAKPQ